MRLHLRVLPKTVHVCIYRRSDVLYIDVVKREVPATMLEHDDSFDDWIAVNVDHHWLVCTA